MATVWAGRAENECHFTATSLAIAWAYLPKVLKERWVMTFWCELEYPKPIFKLVLCKTLIEHGGGHVGANLDQTLTLQSQT
jgi:hypothetical protein